MQKGWHNNMLTSVHVRCLFSGCMAGPQSPGDSNLDLRESSEKKKKENSEERPSVVTLLVNFSHWA